ncbi:hypothetical protein LCGC14_2525750, partial [marine sediment metagenome]
WRILITGIIALTALEIYALSRGINGVLLSSIIAIIGLAIGITIDNPLKGGVKNG